MNGPDTSTALAPPAIPARGKQLRDLTMDALGLFKKKRFNPLEELIECYEDIKALDKVLSGKKFLKDANGDPIDMEVAVEIEVQCKRLKFDVIKEIVQYGTPKLRSVEHTGQVDNTIQIILGVAPKNVQTIEVASTNHNLPAFIEDQQ